MNRFLNASSAFSICLHKQTFCRFRNFLGKDYTGFFLAVILSLGITFELPVLIFFLSLFGIVDAKFLLRHIRYAILIIFIIAACICPSPDAIGMCLFASPMLVLYLIGVGVAYVVHPSRRNRKKAAA